MTPTTPTAFKSFRCTEYEIGICMEEYEENNHWKCHASKCKSKTGPPVKRASFEYWCDTNDLEKEKTGLKDAIDFFFMVVKKQTWIQLVLFFLITSKTVHWSFTNTWWKMENMKIWLLKRLPSTLTNIFLGVIHYIEGFTKSLACEYWYHLDSQVSHRVLFMDWHSKSSETTLLHQL